MDIYLLHPTTFVPVNLLENWKTCSWTESFRKPGSVKITTYKVEETMSLLPLKSLISLDDSAEVMAIETHSIESTDKGDLLTLEGRTLNGAWFDDRATMTVLSNTGSASNMTEVSANDQWPTDLVWDLIASQYLASEGADTANRIANTNVQLVGITHTGDKEDEFALYGQLSDVVVALLTKENAGLRAVRPITTNLGLNHSTIMFEIYQGKNRTAGQSTNPPVIFDVPGGHLIDPKYLMSIQGYKTHAYVVAPGVWQKKVPAPGIVDASTIGKDRKIVYVDAKSDIQSSMTTTKKNAVANRLGKKALAAANAINFIEGEISPASTYVRGTDYDLGDKVTIMGNYGVSQTMLVDAYTRIYDENGETRVPTLIVPGS